MSILHEFRDALVKDLDKKEIDLTNVLIKGEATAHDRTAGKIAAVREIKIIINELVKRWSTRDEEA